MVSQITLGTFGTQNGKNVITGGASQLDTTKIIDGLVAAKRAPAVRLETANKKIDSQAEAFTTFKSLLTKFQTASDSLRNVPGVDVATKNIFEYRKASVTNSTGITATDYIDVTVEAGAAAQSYTINSITQLARQTKQQSGNIAIADSTTASAVTANGAPVAGLFQAGTVNLRAVDGTVGGIALTLNENDSLQVVANKFNEISSRTGIQASIINVSNGVYRLNFSATKTGTTYGFDLETLAPTAGAGVETDASGVFSQIAFSTTQPAQNAIFSIDGISINRESNSIADVVDGVTFTLKQDSMPGTSTVIINPDTTLVANAITQLADAYNEIRLFVSNQTQLNDDGSPKETSVLHDNSVFRSIVDGIANEVSRIVAGVTGSDPTQLSDVGIKLENFDGDDENPATKNIMTLDADKLNSMLLSNFDGVRQLFEYQQSSDNSSFVNFKRSNNLTITSFSVSINQTTGVYTATYTDPANGLTTVNLDGTALTGSVTLKGQSGTIFEGSEFVFASGADATVNVTLTQGYGDRLYNLMNSYLNDSSGALTQEVETLTNKKDQNADEITAIDDRMAAYRDQLIQQYAGLEAALTQANQLLQLLQAQSDARNAS